MSARLVSSAAALAELRALAADSARARKPLGQGTVAGPFEGHLALERSDAAMRQLATKEGIGG